MKLSLHAKIRGSYTAMVAAASIACIGLVQTGHAGDTFMISHGDLYWATNLGDGPADITPDSTLRFQGLDIATAFGTNLDCGPVVLWTHGSTGNTISIGLAPTFAKPKDIVSFRRGAVDPFANSSTYEGVEDTTILQNNNIAGQRDQNYGARANFFVGEAAAASGYLDLDPSEGGVLIDDWTTHTNAGLFLITADEDRDEIQFHSSDAVVLEDRPELIIEFIPTVPTLNIEPLTSGVRVSWLGGGTRWALNHSTDLIDWNPITQTPTADSEGFYVDFPADMPEQFFRMEKK